MTKLIAARDPSRRQLRPSEWPGVDRDLWRRALVQGGRRASQSERTNDLVAKCYGRWLAWLGHNAPAEWLREPGERIREERVADYLRSLEAHCAPLTRISRLEGLYQAALVMGPGENWRWLRDMIGEVRRSRIGPGDAADWPPGATVLQTLGIDLMKDAGQQTTLRRCAMQFRDGLLIALLSRRRMSRRALAAMRIGEHVDRRDGVWLLRTGTAGDDATSLVETPWPSELVAYLERYLTVHRPILDGTAQARSEAAGGAFWIASGGSPMSGMAIYDRVSERTRGALGRNAGTLLFRCRSKSLG